MFLTNPDRPSQSWLVRNCGHSSRGPWQRLLSIVAVAVVLTPLAGCGGDSEDLEPVTGRVTLDGQPLPQASIEFNPVDESGSSAGGFTDDDGNYELRFTAEDFGAVAGEYTVYISKVKATDQGDIETLPSRYNEETTLKRTVTVDGDNVFNFELESK